MNQGKRRLIDCLMLILLIIGIGVLSYPFVSDALNDYLDQQLIAHYQQKAAKENEKAMTEIQEQMVKKNKTLEKEGGHPGTVSFDQETKIPKSAKPTYLKEHTIGVITIPKISVRLPIFDETNPVLLEKGASLLEGTSYPTGGESTHAVLSSHRGLPQAKLFTDLPKLKKGDPFYIESNGQTLAYEVDQIKTVEPTNTDDLHIEKGQDLVTLLTCTPYMVNSHRLLVRGHRIPYAPKEAEKKIQQVTKKKQFLLISLLTAGLAILAILVFLFYKYRRHN
ncbi:MULTISPECIES: class C sortase [unclassified Enterococcus]|uniref:class C sortase n=1 Tax=unclassified Enterococcus TaxID=2608891 RepID=UPI0013EA026B|nr:MULTISPECIES: class C sortase [unclassified Enterococcus]